ncbi:phosphatidylethanolamine N-methyltransferase [Hyphomicrobium nitrativorans NL23]|uniref:Phosphatidylethanolamine N-methyltransferase n=1 Tax=Hyphomicrobium nitrativorans NL23 TaxID=1029756 RepID=V5SEX2_9HYPH|nr:class I SAM-dependent methyltransferase [Hyphomicrobium nitrativorans]AHB48509.1 phosphatidylethanolamine N-methyltransferase [Hyphomicrobium nitrativorans NL23]
MQETKPQMKPRLRVEDLERQDGRITGIGRIEEDVLKATYRRWAPIYDHTFGRVSNEGRKHAAEVINASLDSGRVLEVGVGTGLALGDYGRHLEIVGIDLSPEMLDKARERVTAERLDNVTGLHEMDAGDLQFPDNSFDVVTAMYVMTVVPEPELVMHELARVAKPGGEVIIVNHFSQTEGVRGWVERRMAPFAEIIGWRPVFDQSRVMGCDDLTVTERKALRPWGIFTMMRFRKRASEDERPIAAE